MIERASYKKIKALVLFYCKSNEPWKHCFLSGLTWLISPNPACFIISPAPLVFSFDFACKNGFCIINAPEHVKLCPILIIDQSKSNCIICQFNWHSIYISNSQLGITFDEKAVLESNKIEQIVLNNWTYFHHFISVSDHRLPIHKKDDGLSILFVLKLKLVDSQNYRIHLSF